MRRTIVGLLAFMLGGTVATQTTNPASSQTSGERQMQLGNFSVSLSVLGSAVLRSPMSGGRPGRARPAPGEPLPELGDARVLLARLAVGDAVTGAAEQQIIPAGARQQRQGLLAMCAAHGAVRT